MTSPALKLALITELEADVAARLTAISNATARLLDTDSLTESLCGLGLKAASRGFSANGRRGGYVICCVLRALLLGGLHIDRIVGGVAPEQIEIHIAGFEVPVRAFATLDEARAAALAMGLIANAQATDRPEHLTRQAA
jgi:hypothetical protein